jgi:tetratricopeptide (TPR) repeat protein
MNRLTFTSIALPAALWVVALVPHAVSTQATDSSKTDSIRVGKLLEEALEAAKTIPPNTGDFKAYIAMSIASAQAKAGETKAAEQTFQLAIEEADKMQIGANHKERMLSWIASEQAKAGFTEAASRTALGLNDAPMRVKALMEIVTALGRAGELTRAIKMAEDMERGEARDQALAAIAEQEGKQGRFDEAKTTIAAMTDDYQAILSLALLGNILYAKGQPDASKIWEQAFERASKMSTSDQSAINRKGYSQTEVVRQRASAGDVRAALKMCDAIQGPWQRAAFGAVVHQFVLAGDLRSAERLAQDHLLELSSWTAQAMAVAHFRSGDTKAALRVVDAITSDWRKVEALLAIARAQSKDGKRDEAFSTLKEALRLAERFQNSENIVGGKKGLLGLLLTCQIEVDDIDGARETFKSISSLKGNRADASICEAVAWMAILDLRSGRDQKAVEAIETCDTACMSHPLRRVAFVSTERSDAPHLLRLAPKLQAPQLQAMAFLGTAEGILRKEQDSKTPAKKDTNHP